MPTGYTADVQSGKVTEFADFAMQCARGMGALIMMRDDPMDATIPEGFEPSNYDSKALTEARKALDALAFLSIEEANQAALEEHKKDVAWRVKATKEQQEQRVRYETMLAKVEAYKPPSSDHVGFRDFMLSQLRESIQFDCGCDYMAGAQPILTGEAWIAKEKLRLEKSIAYHEKQHREEVERTEGRNRWLRQLRESLKQPE